MLRWNSNEHQYKITSNENSPPGTWICPFRNRKKKLLVMVHWRQKSKWSHSDHLNQINSEFMGNETFIWIHKGLPNTHWKRILIIKWKAERCFLFILLFDLKWSRATQISINTDFRFNLKFRSICFLCLFGPQLNFKSLMIYE